MALALVRSLEVGDGRILLRVDTGTNPLYRVRLGRSVRHDDVFVQLDDVFWQSPWSRNDQAGQHLDTTTTVVIPAAVAEPRCLVQVVTAKDGGRAAAYSEPRRLVAAPGLDEPGEELLTMSSIPQTSRAPEFAAPAMTGVRSVHDVFSRPASLEDLLGSLARAALPLVQQLLAGAQTPTGVPSAPAAGTAPSGTGDQLAGTIAALLQAVLGAAGTPASAPQSLVARPMSAPHRFRGDLASPFVFGIDDALLASLAGPVLSNLAPLVGKLPELLNASNKYRLDSRNADYQLVQQLIGQMDRARLADQIVSLAEAPPGEGGDPDAADLVALAALLRSAQAPAGGTAAAPAPAPAPTPTPTSAPAPAPAPAGSATPGPAAAAPPSTGTTARPAAPPSAPATGAPALAPTAAPVPTAVAHSLRQRAFSFSTDDVAFRDAAPSRALLVPVSADWTGGPRTGGSTREVFMRDRVVRLRWRWETGAGAPTTPLPRAILRVVVRHPGGGADLLTREERLTDVLPGAELGVSLEQAAVSPLPADTDLEVFAQLRWPTRQSPRQCTASRTVAFTSGAYVAAAGAPAGAPVELTDMNRYRPFWNKLWSSPAPTAERPLWGIDLTLRYSVVLAPDPTNALMEVRSLAAAADDGLRATTSGRMRSGIQVGVPELAKLRSLWPGLDPLDDATLAAFAAPGWLAGQGGDAEAAVRFDGRRHSRGLLWAVPVPTLRSFSVARPENIDAHGQVTSTTVADVPFPVVESVRLLGLVSTGDDATGDVQSPGDPTETSSSYAFDGYSVVFDTLVGLESAHALPQRPAGASGPPAASSAGRLVPVGSP